MKVSEQVAAVIRDLGLIPDEPGRDAFVVERLYHGWAQRARGAWSWSARTPEFHTICGSIYSMTDIVKAHKRGKVVVYVSEHQGMSPELIVEL